MASQEHAGLHAIREVAIRYTGRRKTAPPAIRAPADVAAFMRRAVTDHAREHFVALYLDGRHRPIAHQIVSVGTATASLVHPREVFQPAVLLGACALIVAHNHPSGDPAPSKEDRDVTRRLAQAGKLLGITLLDSIVWTHPHAFFSLRDGDPELFDRN
ncbi:MAG: DNA repair protein RadC [Myxococcota bacterium]